MDTRFLLLARHHGAAFITVDELCGTYFTHLTPAKFVRKVATGEIDLPLIRMDPSSQKGARGVHINSLAEWIDARQSEAVKEIRQMIRK